MYSLVTVTNVPLEELGLIGYRFDTSFKIICDLHVWLCISLEILMNFTVIAWYMVRQNS